MHKLSIVTAAVLTALTLAPIPVLTGPAAAQVLTRVPNNPRPSPSTYSCHNQLGYLRRVYEEQLDQVYDANLVSIAPVCMGEDFGLLRSEGNAGALRSHVADNDAMMRALHAKAFGPEDVVGIRMTGDDAVILYVHPFHH